MTDHPNAHRRVGTEHDPSGDVPARVGVALRPLHHETTPGGLSVHIFEPTGRPEHGVYGAGA